jgi:hypothetical protein
MFENLYDSMKTMMERGCVTKKYIRNALETCWKLFLDRHSESGEVFNTLMFMEFLRTLVHEDDWPVFEQVHRHYGHIDEYGYNTRYVDETPVALQLRPRPDWHVPPTTPEEEMIMPVLENITPTRVDDPLEATKTRRPPPVPSTYCIPDEPDMDPEEQYGDDEMAQDEFTDDRGTGHVGVMEVDTDSVISACDVTPLPHLVPLPSSADASSRQDPNKTHQVHGVVSNNGGPRQIIAQESFHPPPHETAPFPPPMPPMHWVTDEFDRVPEEQRGGMDPDDDEMAAMMEMNW